MVSKGFFALAAVALIAPAARGQEGQQPGGAGGGEGTSGSFEQACVELFQGKPPAGGPDAAEVLRKACNDYVRTREQGRRDEQERAQARQQAQQAGQPAGAAAGTGAGAEGGGQPAADSAASQGTGIGAAFAQAGRELTRSGGNAVLGRRANGEPVGFTLLTNPIGYFTGLGINAEMFGPLPFYPKVSWVGGARYSRTDATNGSVDTFGIEGGVDYFLYGRNNEGFRAGPRLEVAFGRESFQTSTNFGWVGLSGEVGYNFIATNGISGAVATGLGGRIAGDDREDFSSFTGGEFGPYLKVGLGYSW
jgi:hypothetical protein